MARRTFKLGGPLLSVIIPTTQEVETLFFERAVASLANFKNIEVICISQSEAVTRAERLNQGLHKSCGSMILFYHPRSYVDPKGIQYLMNHCHDVIWGGFTHKFDHPHPLLNFTSWYSNKVRGEIRGILYLDHCIFFHRSLWTGDLPKVELFEDTLLSHGLRKQHAPLLLPFTSTTSALRFTKNGVLRQSILNQMMKIGFHLKVPSRLLNRLYEKGLNLN